VKVCPASLAFELRVSPKRTVITVPAGTTIGCAISARGLLLEDDLPGTIDPPPALLPLEVVVSALSLPAGLLASFVAVALFASFAGGLLVQASTVNAR
jgi:hypothetical protein